MKGGVRAPPASPRISGQCRRSVSDPWKRRFILGSAPRGACFHSARRETARGGMELGVEPGRWRRGPWGGSGGKGDHFSRPCLWPWPVTSRPPSRAGTSSCVFSERFCGAPHRGACRMRTSVSEHASLETASLVSAGPREDGGPLHRGFPVCSHLPFRLRLFLPPPHSCPRPLPCPLSAGPVNTHTHAEPPCTRRFREAERPPPAAHPAPQTGPRPPHGPAGVLVWEGLGSCPW